MKKIALFTTMIFLILSGITVFAQDNDDVPDTIVIEVFRIQDVIVMCPENPFPQPVLEQADLILDFLEAEDVLIVPDAELLLENEQLVLQITNFALNCASSEEDAAVIDRSPGFALEDSVPNPENLPGIAEIQAGYALVNTSAANLRSCDSPTCTRVATVNGGESLIVLGRNEDESWWFVQAGDIRGWIWDDLILLRGNLADTPVVFTRGETTPPTLYIGFRGNPLYNNLTSRQRVICNVEGDRFYPLVGRTRNNEWFMIDAACLDGRTLRGWVSADVGLVRNTGLVDVPVFRGFAGDNATE